LNAIYRISNRLSHAGMFDRASTDRSPMLGAIGRASSRVSKSGLEVNRRQTTGRAAARLPAKFPVSAAIAHAFLA
jgi:hypothetical protein